MTSDKAIQDLRRSIELGLCPSKESRKTAIKALEQENVLDKISAELAEWESVYFGENDYRNGYICGINRALQIIDKYREGDKK